MPERPKLRNTTTEFDRARRRIIGLNVVIAASCGLAFGAPTVQDVVATFVDREEHASTERDGASPSPTVVPRIKGRSKRAFFGGKPRSDKAKQ